MNCLSVSWIFHFREHLLSDFDIPYDFSHLAAKIVLISIGLTEIWVRPSLSGDSDQEYSSFLHEDV